MSHQMKLAATGTEDTVCQRACRCGEVLETAEHALEEASAGVEFISVEDACGLDGWNHSLETALCPAVSKSTRVLAPISNELRGKAIPLSTADMSSKSYRPTQRLHRGIGRPNVPLKARVSVVRSPRDHPMACSHCPVLPSRQGVRHDVSGVERRPPERCAACPMLLMQRLYLGDHLDGVE